MERAWQELAPVSWVDSSQANYDLLPFQRYRQLPFVDIPYDPRREEHWADASRIADFVSWLPTVESGERSTVLDIGPGDGWPSIPIADTREDVRVIGLEPSSRRTLICKRNARRLNINNVCFLMASAMKMPIADESVDLVTASYSLEEVTDSQQAMREIYRVLRPGGFFRVAYQQWDLPVQELESVSLLEGDSKLLFQYIRRVREPRLERRYTLALGMDGPGAVIHREALITSASEPRVLGETRLDPGSPLGPNLLVQLASYATSSLAVELRRWTTDELITDLEQVGFSEVWGTLHSGERGRVYGREQIAEDVEIELRDFNVLAEEIGVRAAATEGTGMVTARRSLRDF